MTASGLVRTARLTPYGTVIPALHDAASDQPIGYIPVCGHDAGVPVCLNPAYRRYLPEVAADTLPSATPGSAAQFDQELPLLSVHAFVTGDGAGTAAQQAVQAALLQHSGLPFAAQPQALTTFGLPAWAGQGLEGLVGSSRSANGPGTPAGRVYAAARRLAALPSAARPGVGSLRLAWLYLRSRRAPAALGLLAGLGALLGAALHWEWNVAGGSAAQALIPLTIETGAAAVIAVTTYGPFGDPERATGRWLPWLRLAAAVALAAAAFGSLAAGAVGGALPGGTLALLRDFAGMAGTGLLSAASLGGAFGWTGPMAYWLAAESVLAAHWTTPWIWPARSPHDRGAAICAALVLGAGIAAITLLGARDSGRHDHEPR